ncbi:hypothetical protein [Streptomyces sp. NPDC056663]|uniref:hypothetical protein n=1 Tax=Streptomyces sp. NPDC056663 TaxID=3345899 RepID=UPI0036BD8661
MTYLAEGPAGPEPVWLWLWLNEQGLPFQPASWEGVFLAASDRCEEVSGPVMEERPLCTPHMCRHSFALYMLVVLHHVMDVRISTVGTTHMSFLDDDNVEMNFVKGEWQKLRFHTPDSLEPLLRGYFRDAWISDRSGANLKVAQFW